MFSLSSIFQQFLKRFNNFNNYLLDEHKVMNLSDCTHREKMTVSIISRWDFVFNMTIGCMCLKIRIGWAGGLDAMSRQPPPPPSRTHLCCCWWGWGWSHAQLMVWHAHRLPWTQPSLHSSPISSHGFLTPGPDTWTPPQLPTITTTTTATATTTTATATTNYVCHLLARKDPGCVRYHCCRKLPSGRLLLQGWSPLKSLYLERLGSQTAWI